MTRSNSLRALTLAAVLALGTPLTAFAAPANKGGAAQASEFQAASPMAVTHGSVNVAENTGRSAHPQGNPLTAQASVAQYQAGDNMLANRGNGAVDSSQFGIGAQG